MQNLPLGRQDFRVIREKDYLYVDKTKYIYKLINESDINFLSRPRRFGKSLLINTFKELYEGNEELFKGLYIYNKWDFNKTHPVIKLDFGEGEYESLVKLKLTLDDFLDSCAEDYDVELKKRTISRKFGELIKKIYKKTGKKLVVLVDEYDRAITENLGDNNLLEDIQAILRSFYNVLKTNDQYIEFIFITGVFKICNTSIFSTLNSTTDLTLDEKYSCICGYTYDELEDYFKEHIINLGNKLGLSYNETIKKINYWYDGYSWDGKNKVYSPYSTIELLYYGEFNNYWFKTGTPKSLVDFLKEADDYSEVLNPILIKNSRLDPFTYEHIDPIAIFFETGYLTVSEKKIINDVIYYKLQSPNFEVENSMLDYLIDLNFVIRQDENIKVKLIEYMGQIDNENFQKIIKEFLTHIPSRIHIDQEYYYQSIFIAWLNGLGFKSEGEIQTNLGLMDVMILEKENTVIIGECKFSKMKENKNEPIIPYKTMLDTGINQIKDKKYYEKYPNKRIIMVTFAFAGKEVYTDLEELTF
ncbi:AAA family ATPase [Methanobrevibacter filiformis]|uniref:Putative AAA-ATPase n=1 Tax=Methanobrevibacter filiformis TaxID=55758 RepID=A0A165ZK34_9EURY|nr:AAA family ATPase [Methanobrevibacter filiformis]KZX10823.1 putative AAA-ATPase [Methanobrevibacter filiformis]